MSFIKRGVALLALLGLIGCAAGVRKPGPVRSVGEAKSIAVAHAGTIAFEGTRMTARRVGPNWIVTGEDRRHSAAPVVVTIDAATGSVRDMTGMSYDVRIETRPPPPPR